MKQYLRPFQDNTISNRYPDANLISIGGEIKKTELILNNNKTESETRGRNGWAVPFAEAKREQ